MQGSKIAKTSKLASLGHVISGYIVSSLDLEQALT